MSLSVVCSQCGRSHRVNDRLAGRSVRCPSCDTIVVIPMPADRHAEHDQPPVDRVDTEVPASPPVEADDTSPEVLPVEHAEPTGTRRGRWRVPAEEESGWDEGGSAVEATGPAEAVLFHDVEEEETLRRRKRSEEELDMTPMVDVTFLLLIFFMVTASFSLQKSIEMPRQTTDLPSSAAIEVEPEELEPVELEIDEFGGFYVITADFEEETPGKQNLIRTLKRAVGNSQEGMQLKIRVHESAKLQSLVDGMDAGTIAGFTEIEVNQVEDL